MPLRKPPPPNPELERLIEDRIDLNVRLVILREAQKPDLAEVQAVEAELEAVEAKIALHARDPNRWNCIIS
jgi:primosomal protein N''